MAQKTKSTGTSRIKKVAKVQDLVVGTRMKGHAVKNTNGKQGITCPAHGLVWDVETGFLI